MRKTFIISIFILTFCLLPKIADAGIILRPVFHTGLVGYWDFQEGAGMTAYDKSGYENHGTLNNMEETDWVDGKIGKAIEFGGTPEHITAGTEGVDGAAGHYNTVVFWMYYSGVLGKEVFNWGVEGYYDLWFVNATCFGFNTGGGEVLGTSQSGLNNRWVHVAAVFYNGTPSATDNKLYIDGVQQNISYCLGSGSSSRTAGGTLSWGRACEGYEFSGKIDEGRVYNRELSASEIQRLYKLSQPKMLAPTKTGLVGYWSFEEGTGTNVGDMSGNGNTGTWNGTGSHWTTGKLGTGGSFNGSDDYVEVPDADVLDIGNGSITLSAWVNVSNFVNGGAVIDKRGNTSASYYQLKLSNTGGFVGWQGLVHDGTNLRAVDATSTYRYLTNTWYHLVLVYDTSNATSGTQIYANAVLEETNPTAVATITNNQPVWIGTGSQGDFPGQIDEVRIYNRALETSDITALYNSGLAKINASQNNQLTNGLVGLWSFNGPDMDGDTAIDRSGQGNNGTFTPASPNGPTRAIGKLGQALSFDGSNDYVDFGSASAISNFDEFSIVLWAYFNSPFDDESGIVYHIEDYYNNSGFWFWTWDSSHFEIGVRDADSVVNGQVYPTLTADTWYHMVVRWTKNDKIELFVNGASVGSVPTPNVDGVVNATSTLLLGYSPQNPDSWLNAKIDEFRIYNRALSAQEILRLYNLGR